MADNDVIIDPDSTDDAVGSYATTPSNVPGDTSDDDTSSPDDGNQDGDGDDAARVEKRLKDTESALKERQAELTRTNQELAALRVVREELARQREEGNSAKSDAELWQDEKWREAFDNDPSAHVPELLTAERQRIVSLLEARDNSLKAHIETLLKENLNPDRQRYAPVLEKLGKTVPGFEKLSNEQKLAIAKITAQNDSVDTLDPPSGSFAGTGRRATNPKREQEEQAKQTEAIRRRMFGAFDRRNTEDALYPMGKEG